MGRRAREPDCNRGVDPWLAGRGSHPMPKGSTRGSVHDPTQQHTRPPHHATRGAGIHTRCAAPGSAHEVAACAPVFLRRGRNDRFESARADRDHLEPIPVCSCGDPEIAAGASGAVRRIRSPYALRNGWPRQTSRDDASRQFQLSARAPRVPALFAPAAFRPPADAGRRRAGRGGTPRSRAAGGRTSPPHTPCPHCAP